MIRDLAPNDLVRNDTKMLVAFAEMGDYPCQYCKRQETCNTSTLCRAWPIWFKKHWSKIQMCIQR